MKKVGVIIAVVVLVLVLCTVGLVMLGRHHPMSEGNLVGTYAFPAGFPNVTALSDEKYILRREGILELWDDGKKQSEGKWSIKNGKIHIVAKGYDIFEVTDDGNLKLVARVSAVGVPKKVHPREQRTLKKELGEEEEEKEESK